MSSRVEFRLSMPSRGSWNGEWSGARRNYVIVRTLSTTEATALVGDTGRRSWWHRWEDGWAACVTATLLTRGERATRSDGFCGYDWMVSNILRYGDTREPEAVR